MTMTSTPSIDPALSTALDRITDFIRQVTGIEPTASEIADALTRYFVLNEIKDHVLMLREGAAGTADNR
jgi:hypothetical protein